VTAVAIGGTIARIQTLADGTWRLIIDCHEKPPSDLLEVHCGVAVSRMRTQSETSGNGEYSGLARELHASGFFLRPAIWLAIGSTLCDSDPEKWFREFIHTKPCWAADRSCAGDVVCAHVSLTEADERGELLGAHGTGIKARFSAVPLCDHHHTLQHNKGWTHIAPLEDWRRARIRYVSEWAALALKGWLNADHWYNVDPADLATWADEQGGEILAMLPASYRQAVL
jgi:hypothetical protein